MNHALRKRSLLFGTCVVGSGLLLSKQQIFCQTEDGPKQASDAENGLELERYWKISSTFAKDVRQRVESTSLVRFGRAASTV